MNRSQIPHVYWLHDVDQNNIAEVGGKNASLGEMLKHLTNKNINVPLGFATTSACYRKFIDDNGLRDSIKNYLDQYSHDEISVEEAGRAIRKLIEKGIFPIPVAEDIRNFYRQLCDKYEMKDVDVAVRSSATAEDLPGASFAGLQETYLNIRGEEDLLEACRKCFASLFTARAIVYREEKGFDHFKVALSVGVQKMIRANDSCSGVIFTLDTESGFPDVVIINGAWGLGENIVRGVINPDEYTVFKPLLDKKGVVPILEKKLGSKEQKLIYAFNEDSRVQNISTTAEERATFVLSDEEILTLARWGIIIEKHYGCPMDIEWVKDDRTEQLYVVQARPETVHAMEQDKQVFQNYRLKEKDASLLLTGLSIGNKIVNGRVKKINSVDDLADVTSDDILVTQMTEPDWVPSMKKAAGIITDAGGRTCHAAIVSRELGIPAIVGTKHGTSVLKEGQSITLSCAEGDEGKIFNGLLEYQVEEVNLGELQTPKTKVMLNLAVPESAFKWWKMPVQGVGLARMEFIINQHIKIHPKALINFDKVLQEHDREKIRKLTHGYRDKTTFFVDQLAQGIAKIAASQYPNPVIVRTSDFKTNEYADLLGGSMFEPKESNPMLGWRGACRYYSEGYAEGFALECKALKKVREQIGLDNVVVMIPFCRTVEEAKKILKVMESHGLKRGQNGLQIYMMSEIPSNVILARKFANYFDGFSIGSNDLTQLILGVDRDSAELSYLFDENNEAVKEAIRQIIQRAHQKDITVGFCGQAPSDNPAYAAFLVQAGIDSVSVNPDSVIDVLKAIGKAEEKMKTAHA